MVEEEHGHILVCHVITYVTASKHGLSETELLDILACDREVCSFLLCLRADYHCTITCSASVCKVTHEHILKGFATTCIITLALFGWGVCPCEYIALFPQGQPFETYSVKHIV